MKHKKKLITFTLFLATLAYANIPDYYPQYPASDHYNPVSQTFFNYEPQRPVENALPAMWQLVTDEAALHPNQPLPIVKPDWQAFLNQPETSQYIWFGHSTLMMRLNQQTIITDPVFAQNVSPVPIMMNRFQPAPAEYSELPPLDVVLISHNHYDHLEQATIEKMAQAHHHFIVPLGIGTLLQKWGIAPNRITELDWWQSTTRNGITYTAVPARHDSARGTTDRNKTLWAGWVLQHQNEQIYFSGDSSYGKHFAQIGERFGGFDIAFIENGQYNERWPDNHMFPEQTAQVAAQVKAKRFVPIHWGAYPMALHAWNDPVKRSVPAARALGVQTLTPIQGQVFDAHTVTEDWFL